MAKKQDKVPVTVQKTDKKSTIDRFLRYVEDSKLELRKITWPTLAATRKISLAVLGFVAIMAIILGLVDLCLSNLIRVILS